MKQIADEEFRTTAYNSKRQNKISSQAEESEMAMDDDDDYDNLVS